MFQPQRTRQPLPQQAKHRLNIIRQLLTAIFTVLLYQNTYAETRYYDIEVIIYEDADSKYINSEHWPQRPLQVDGEMENLSLSAAASADNQEEKSSQFDNIEPSILSSEADRLARSRHYNMLFYGAWTQAGLSSSDAFSINLKQLNNHAKVNTANTIEGTLKVVLARYLHIYTDLEYIRQQKRQITVATVPAALTGETTTESETSMPETTPMVEFYPVISHRRMRSKTLHYIDHPLVGILVQINQVTNKSIKAESTEAEN